MSATPQPRPLTGRGVLIICLACFGVVIAVNLTLAVLATGSFPGLVVANSYVASQGFDREKAAQQALGWSVSVRHAGGVLTVTVTGRDGAPVPGLALAARIARPATEAEAESLTLAAAGSSYQAATRLAPGLWRVALNARGPGGEVWQAEARIEVPVPPAAKS